MDKITIIVSAVVGSLGVLSAIFGFSAEGTKLTPYDIFVLDDGECIYPQNPAQGLGICAAIFLLVAQVTFTAVGGCCGCCRSRSFPSETKRIVGIVCAVVSWIAVVIAFVLFIEGATLNANGVREADPYPYCTHLKDGIFAGAGVLALAATALSITSFIMQRSRPAGAGDAAAAAAAAPASAAATTAAAGGQPPPLEVVIGRPVSPPGKPHNDYPEKPQGYEVQRQQVLPTTESLPQGGYSAQAPQNLQPSPAAAQNNNAVYYPPIHQLSPRPSAPPAPAAPAAVVVAAAAATEQSVLQPVLGGVAIGQPLPQVVPLSSSLPSAPPSAVGSASSAGQPGLSTVIRNEVAKEAVKFAAHMVTQSLFSDNTIGDGVLSMVTGSAGVDADDVQTTN